MNEPLFSHESSLFLPPDTRTFPPPNLTLDTAWNGFLIPDSRLWQINEAWNILETAIITQTPSHVFLLFSGGYDSLIATHLSALLLHDTVRKYADHFRDKIPEVRVLHINTGIGIPQTREFVRNVSYGYGWSYLEYTTPVSYEENVLRYGFPGGAQHWRMYVLLKERALRMAIKDHTPPHPLEIHKQELYCLLNDMQRLPLSYQYIMIRVVRRYLTRAIKEYREKLRPVMFVTGVRRAESVRRMGNVVPMQRRGRQWWISPLTNWLEGHVLDYRDANHLPHNLVSDVLHKSGECLCGAFAKANELQDICTWFPDVGAYIKDLERRVWKAGFHWGWEEGPPRRKKRHQANRYQLALPGFDSEWSEGKEEMPSYMGFSPLCSSCNAQFEREEEQRIIAKPDQPFVV